MSSFFKALIVIALVAVVAGVGIMSQYRLKTSEPIGLTQAELDLFVDKQLGFREKSQFATDADAPLTDGRYHALGVGLSAIGPDLGAVLAQIEALAAPIPSDEVLGDPRIAALGRYVVTRVPEDIGKFRTPSLRNVAITGPYFHDGSVDTLDAAVDLELYYRRQSDGTPVVLSRAERNDLIEFLTALTDIADGRIRPQE